MSDPERREFREYRFVPLEERIVLDATLVFDVGQITFLDQDYPSNYGENDLDNIEKTSFFFDTSNLQNDGLDQESIALSGEEEGYSDFIVHNEPICLSLDQAQRHTEYDLTQIYPAGDLLVQMGFLNFEISQNSNPDLLSAQVENALLKLDYAENEIGEADLLVRGTYLDGKVYDTPFHIHVDVTNDGLFEYDSDSSSINPWAPAIYDDSSIDIKTELLQLEQDAQPTNSDHLGTLIAQTQEAVHEMPGFFGKPSFEEGSWVNTEIADSK